MITKAPVVAPATRAMTIKEHLKSDALAAQIRDAMPKGEGERRMMRAALTSLQKNPKLAEAAESNQPSFFASLLTASQMGLIPDGRSGHLVNFWNSKKNIAEIQFIADYKGLVALILESGKVSYLHADVVCENDEFVEDRGQIITHKINRRKPRGAVYAVYALARFKDGTEKAEVLDRSEVEAIRARSKSKDGGPWTTDWNEMAKKTAMKRLSKWLPLTPDVQDRLAADEEEVDSGVVVSSPPVPQNRPRQVADAPWVEGYDEMAKKKAMANVIESSVDLHSVSVIEIQSWAEDSEVVMSEVFAWLKSVGKMPPNAKMPATWNDFTSDEIDYVLENGHAATEHAHSHRTV